jgi:nicotinamide phosphoribosyltransferase
MENIKENNIMLNSDSYKVSHHLQIPSGTTKVYSYLESRGGEYDYTVFTLLQYILEKNFVGKIVTKENIDIAEMFWTQHFGYKGLFNRAMWEHILEKYDGHLPIRIKAVPEGTVVPVKNVLMTIENTDDKCTSLTNFLETTLLQIWAPITIATNSRTIKVELIDRIMKTTDMNINEANEAANFMLHDFGYRGVSSFESAGILGAAHLTSFMGTDTVPAIVLLMNYYNAEMCGFSVPASEHSTATPWGRGIGERTYLYNMLKQHPTGIVSIVSDSYNVYDFVNMAGTDGEIKRMILERDGKTVFRPDSGDPIEVNRILINNLWENFGGTINEKGYKVINPSVGIIQGDGIDKDMVSRLLDMLEEEGFAATTLVYGSGGGLLQKFNRDTMKFAIKCSFMIRNGVEINVQKDPITAPGKKSKTGRLKLVKTLDGYTTLCSNDEGFDSAKDEMVTVFENGKLLVKYTLDEIRERTKITERDLENHIEKINL